MGILSNIGDFLGAMYEMVFEMVQNIIVKGGFLELVTILMCIQGLLILLGLALWTICGILILFSWLALLIRTKEIRKKIIEATVIEKEYKPKEREFKNTILKKLTANFDKAKYNVYVEYDGIKEVFDDKELFEATSVNEKVNLLLIERINREGIAIKRTLKLPE